jgi:hypothetical protein
MVAARRCDRRKRSRKHSQRGEGPCCRHEAVLPGQGDFQSPQASQPASVAASKIMATIRSAACRGRAFGFGILRYSSMQPILTRKA